MSRDPWTLLGVESGADAVAVEGARQRALAAAAGDASAVARIDAACALVLDPRACARDRLFGPRAFDDLDEAAAALRRLPRRPVGAVLWLEALRDSV